MQLLPSAHVDTFCRDNLPPLSQWPRFRFELPELEYPQRLNCAQRLLDEPIQRLGRDRRCLLTPDGQWSYGELLDRANQIAHVLVEDLGLVPGNRVLLRAPNNPWLVAAWFGVVKAGGVVVLTMPLLRAGELRTMLGLTRTELALCDHRYLEDLEASRDNGSDGFGSGDSTGSTGITDLRIVSFGGDGADDLLASSAGKPTSFDAVDTSADDVALLAPTSGTTGRPKITAHFHRDVLANADTFSRHVLRPQPEDLFTSTAPFAFTFGLGALLVFPLHAGAASLLVEKATPPELADLVAAHGVSVLFTAPTAYKAMIAGGASEKLTSLRRCVSAGEPLPKSTWDAFHEATGLRLIDGIGATEMLHIFISCADDDVRPGATGRPVPGYVAKVVGATGEEVPDGQQGRLAVQGPTGCRYLADDRQLVYVQDGWNVTGDTYVRDADGYFWYQARSDDMIISSGYNIAGPEVEAALMAHPDVVECAVVGVPDDARGQLVKAFVVLREGADAGQSTEHALQEHVKARIAPYKYPRAIEFRDELPKTQSGKLQRFRLRSEVAPSQDAPVGTG